MDDTMDGGRRYALKTLAGFGAMILFDCGGSSPEQSLDGAADAGEASRAGDAADEAADDGMSATDAGATTESGVCVLDPNVTKGPYWVDGQLDRSDITSDSTGAASPNPRPGLPLSLRFTVMAYAAGACMPLEGAQVDIWHCDATGVYSGAQNMGGPNTTGQNFLRGHQKTDSSGVVHFTSIYPGWYSGRAVHIHVKIRLFDANSNTTTEATTQVFFDDSTTDAVYAQNAPYDTRSTRDTRNATDMIYGGHTELVVQAQGSVTSGFAASVSLGVAVGVIRAG